MKTHLSITIQKNQRRRGAVLLLAVLFFVFTALYLASYLYLCRHEYTSVSRSQTFNGGMVMAEAGVEDALTFINQNAGGQVGTLGNWSSTAATYGWSVVSTNGGVTVYSASGRSPDPTLGSYTVYITNNPSGTTNGPTILSIGTAYWNSGMTTLTATNDVRKVLVYTAGSSQGSLGVIAYAGMDFKGNNVTMDSFDSADPNHSIWQTAMLFHGVRYGLYSDSLSYSSNSLPSRTSDVMVATDGTSINVGNANIYGFVDTGPGGTVSINKNGSVGDLNWVSTGTSGIESGHGRDDMNQTFTSKSLPTAPFNNLWQNNWLSVPTFATGGVTNIIRIGAVWGTNSLGGWTNGGGTLVTNINGSGFNIAGTVYHLVITNRIENITNVNPWIYYAYSNSLSQNIFVDSQYTILYLPNGMSLSGNATFSVNTNADVTIYAGSSISLSGNAVIDNNASYAHAFSIYDIAGDPISISAAGNGIGTAFLYVPSSSVSFSGGGSGNYGFVGCVFCQNISVNGHYTFHFDESLNQTTNNDEYLPVSWQEVE